MKRNTNAPEVGDERIITCFLWLPKKIEGQVRWLEKAKIWQRLERSNGRLAWVDEAYWDGNFMLRRKRNVE